MHVQVHTDGGSRGNPGPAAAAAVVTDKAGNVLHRAGIFLGTATNNVAEYHGLLTGLMAAAGVGACHVQVLSDSELLVRQMNGQYRVRNAGLRPLFEKARGLSERFDRCEFTHVRRERNEVADALVNEALDLRRNVGDAAD